jgi:hypothetical protein
MTHAVEVVDGEGCYRRAGDDRRRGGAEHKTSAEA